MSKIKSKNGIYHYIYKNEPFKGSGQDCVNLFEGIFESLKGTLDDDTKLINKGESKIQISIDRLSNVIKGEVIKYLTHSIEKSIKPSKKRTRRKNAKSERRQGTESAGIRVG